MNFVELSESYKDAWQRTTGGRRLFVGSSLKQDISAFLQKYGFNNLEYIDKGSSAIILKDVDNPDLVYRIAPIYSEDTRAVIPQVLQAIHVPIFDKALKVEFLPNISVPDSLDGDPFWKLMDQFKKEVNRSGHRLESVTPHQDVGLLRYEDSTKPGTFREAFVAADASLIPPVEGATPSCGDDYPSLEDQWRVQCRMVEKDARLKALLNGMPARLPETLRISLAP